MQPALEDAIQVPQHGGSGGPAARALAHEYHGAGALALVPGHVVVIQDAALRGGGGEKHRLHIGVDLASGGGAALGHQAAAEPPGLDALHVLGGDALDALVAQALHRQQIIGHRGTEDDLTQGVQAGDIGAGVRLRIAQALGIAQSLVIAQGAALHGVQHIVGGAVEDAAQGDDQVALHGDAQVMQEGHPTAAGGAEQEAHPLLSGCGSQLDPMGRHQSLIGGDKVLAGFQGRHGIAEGRLNAAHGLRHSFHTRLRQNGLYACALKGSVILSGPYQNRPLLQPFCICKHLINPGSNGAEAQNSNFHFILHVCVRILRTFVFLAETV